MQQARSSAGHGGERPRGGRGSQLPAPCPRGLGSGVDLDNPGLWGGLRSDPVSTAPEELLNAPCSSGGTFHHSLGIPTGHSRPFPEQGWRSRNCSHAWGSALPSPGQAPSKTPRSWAHSRYFSSFKVWELISKKLEMPTVAINQKLPEDEHYPK